MLLSKQLNNVWMLSHAVTCVFCFEVNDNARFLSEWRNIGLQAIKRFETAKDIKQIPS
jgi:hypothetical protein